MSARADEVALAAAAVAGVVAIAVADGPYEPFESVMGVVLAILLAVLYRPPTPESGTTAWVKAAAAAAVGALVLCLVLSFPVDQAVRAVAADGGNTDLSVSWVLSALWLIGFLNLLVALRFTVLRVPAAAEDPDKDALTSV
ncbi:hypothetical protein [Luedemannella flava]|uniref:hypothetical protein n=1 Tax=Luedemannella flava TaxID=349316 RepID=UPI0031E32815